MSFISNKDNSDSSIDFSIENKSMKILFAASDNDKSSGAFLSMITLIDILRKKYSIDFFVILPGDGDGIELLEDKKIPYKVIKSITWVIPISIRDSKSTKIKTIVKKILNIKAIKEISKFIEENDIDIVHINTTYSYVAAKSAIELNVPLVWHLREFLEQHQNNTLWDREWGNKLINQADKIIVISDSLKEKYVNVFDEDKLVRIYDSVDDDGFYKPDKEIFNNDLITFIMVGRFNYPKGQLDYANACAKLYSSGFTNFEAWLVGEGDPSFNKQLVDIFESVNMDNYKFFGYRKDVDKLYELADISFTCSEFEAFGRTTVEAMLSGNLVIGANSGATTELIRDNRGILFKLHDSDDLFNKIKYALDNPVVSKKIAESGREYMFDILSPEKNADEVFKVYYEILNK